MYATRTDLTERYGTDEVTQRESMLPVGAVDKALADATADIDSYVSARYTVPLAPVPGNVVRLACSIARYYLLGDAATERARDDYKDAVSFLRDVQAGRAVLDGAAAPANATPAATVAVTNGRAKVFAGGLS